jgi:glycosyltransferase involved in cell wall biosynthesis
MAKFIQVFNRYLKSGGEEASGARIAGHLELGGHTVVRFWRSSHEWSGPHSPSKFSQLFLMWNNAVVLNELRALHQREKPQAWILHNVVPVISLGVYRLAGELDVPIIQWLHNYRPLSPSGTLQAGDRKLRPDDPWLVWKEILAGSWRGRFLTGWLAWGYARIRRRGDFSSVRAWIAVSDEMKAVFLRAGRPEERIFTLRHSWNIKSLNIPPRDEGHFLFLGRMIEAKGVRFLLELFQHSSLKSVPLVMAGDGPLYHELKERFQRACWVGHVQGEEKQRLIAGCRAVVFPSLWPEPLSTVAYEAYESGKPILSSSVGGMKELVRERETGRLLPPGDSEMWLGAVMELVRNPDLAHQWGAIGRQWLEKNVSPATWNRQFSAILEKVLA